MPKFINPATVVAQSGIQPGYKVADLGCGAGFYAVAAAKLVGDSGLVYAVDIVDEKLAVTQSTARQAGSKNILVIHADLDKPLQQIEQNSCDMVIVASILHEISSPTILLQNAYRILKTGGRVLAVDWKKELTPLGPSIEKRLGQDELENILTQCGLRKEKEIKADSYHYAVVFIK